MSLLKVAQRVADAQTLPAISQVLGNEDDNVRQIRQWIQEGGNDLAQTTNADGGSWSILERIYEFASVADQGEYSLPADFEKFISNTAWQREKYWQLRGSLTPQQWERQRNRRSNTAYNVFRIFRTQNGSATTVQKSLAQNTIRKFHLEPPTDGGTTLVYEYVSNYWWVSEDGSTFRREPEDDTDEPLFGDDLLVLYVLWRFKAANGFDFSSDLALFETKRDRMLVQDRAAEPISVGRSRHGYANRDESDVDWYCW